MINQLALKRYQDHLFGEVESLRRQLRVAEDALENSKLLWEAVRTTENQKIITATYDLACFTFRENDKR